MKKDKRKKNFGVLELVPETSGQKRARQPHQWPPPAPSAHLPTSSFPGRSRLAGPAATHRRLGTVRCSPAARRASGPFLLGNGGSSLRHPRTPGRWRGCRRRRRSTRSGSSPSSAFSTRPLRSFYEKGAIRLFLCGIASMSL